MKGPSPLRVQLAHSRLWISFVVGAYLASALLLAFVPGSMLLRATAVSAIGAYALWTLRNGALRATPRSIVGVEIVPDGTAVLIEKGGAQCPGRVRPSSYVGTALVTLVVRPDGARWSRAIAILPDMVSAEEMRRLRVLLRVIGTNGEGATGI